MIFSGARPGSGRHVRPGDARRAGRHAALRRDDAGRYDDAAQADEWGGDVQHDGAGPYDISAAPDMTRLDLGSLQIPAMEGVEVRVQADEEGAVQNVVLVHGDDALQLGVFAAPKSEGIWDEIREEIRASLYSDGVAAQEVEGEYGIELQARIRTPEGLTDIRFIGVDGPRWMVRGVYQGAAAVDPSRAGPLAECLRGLVVNRGQEAKPVREPLELRLPPEANLARDAAGPPASPSGPAAPNGGPAAQAAASAADGPRRRPSPRPRRSGGHGD